MTTIIQINKNGTIKENTIEQLSIDNLHKLAKTKGKDKIEKLNTWNYNKNIVSLYGYRDGNAGKENKYENPQPVDKELYFGDIFYIHTDKTEKNIVTFNKKEFKVFYEKQMGGFENLDEMSDNESHLDSDNEYEEDSFLVKDSDYEEWKDEDEESEFMSSSNEEEEEDIEEIICKNTKQIPKKNKKVTTNKLFKDDLDDLLDNNEELTEDEINYQPKKYKLGNEIIKIKIVKKKKQE